MSFWERQTRRAANEDGIALVLAVVFMGLIAIMATAMLFYTSGSQRDASLKQSGQSAYALGEAGVNQALAQLASNYYDSSGNTTNNTTAFATTWFTGASSSQQQSPTSAAGCTASSTCMSWSLVSCSFYAPVPTGCSLISGTPSGPKVGTVVLKGTGTVPNPGGGTPLKRSVTVSVDINQPVVYLPPPPYWTEIYSGAPPTDNCATSLSLGQGVNITAPLYVGGDLCLTSSASISGSNVNVKVFGWVWSRQQSSIGSSNGSPPRVNSIQVAGGCSNSSNTQPTMSSGCTINANGGAFWDSNPTTPHAPTSPAAETLPTIDWTWIANHEGSPTPVCSDGRSLSTANFQLTPSASYSCSIPGLNGSINYTYNPSGTSTLVVKGDVYFPNGLVINTNNTLVQYSGISGIFVGGNNGITISNNSFLCAKIASGTCDFNNATNTSSPGYWDTTQSLMLLQAQGAVNATNFRFQGGIYSATSISLGGGQGCTQGPLLTPNLLSVGQQLNGTFPTFQQVPSGTLGEPSPYTVGKPYGGTY